MSGEGWWLTLSPPGSPAQAVAALRERDLFPEGETWWFAWREEEVRLPGLLTDPASLDGPWDALRVFSPRAELRWSRRGRGWGCWLLLEEDPEAALGDLRAWVRARASFRVQTSHRILWGRRMAMPDGRVSRGEILFPRELAYPLPDDDPAQALVADVVLYVDEEGRLQTARYARLYRRPPSARSLPVPPCGTPTEAAATGR